MVFRGVRQEYTFIIGWVTQGGISMRFVIPTYAEWPQEADCYLPNREDSIVITNLIVVSVPVPTTDGKYLTQVH